MVKKTTYLIGLDEAGRGPLAGPVAVAAVALMSGVTLDIRMARVTLRDSKQLSPLRREQWFRWLKQAQRNKKLNFAVSLVGEKIIDRRGIVPAVKIGIGRVLRRLKIAPGRSRVLLDGGLRAPAKYKNQRTIIRGDQTIPIIMLAATAAKVRRDRRMVRLARRYPNYQFDIHKGYGTRRHYIALRHHGLSPLHRRSFLKNLKDH
ncbi:MAG TPA: ribonuclease HII [Candidatus Paceibacterota bacterium]